MPRIDPSLFDCKPPPMFPSGQFMQSEYAASTERLAGAYVDCRGKLEDVRTTIERQRRELGND